jgi:2-polyprenyl-3-methyl-5-hydroxy-6-metoxy-1,4-benzoquinol methylase
MDRRSKIFQGLDPKGFGLEIGPSHNPIAPKKAGFNVKVLDHLSEEALIQKYVGHGVCLENIEHVDYVWNGGPFAELVGAEHVFDWIIASHVIEHTPCLITFLKYCEAVLKECGVLSLAIPDKRYCFDVYREKTSLSAVVDAFRQKRTIHSPGTAAEYFLNVAAKGGNIAWSHNTKGETRFVHGLSDAKQAIKAIEDDGAYLDLHSWVFTPCSFRLMMEDLYQLGYIRLRETCFFDTEGSEFYIKLGLQGCGSGLTRLELVRLNAEQV